EAEAHDREPPGGHAQRARQAGGEGPSARRAAGPSSRRQEPRAALRARTGEGHPGPLEDGEVGLDRGDPQAALTSAIESPDWRAARGRPPRGRERHRPGGRAPRRPAWSARHADDRLGPDGGGAVARPDEAVRPRAGGQAGRRATTVISTSMSPISFAPTVVRTG